MAVHCTTAPPSLDGVLDEQCWQSALPATDFLLKEPREGTAASLRTEVRFVYNDRALYIGARMFHDNTSEIVSTLSRRDNAGNSERIILTFDTYNDRRTSYSFCVTADGVRVDYYHSEDQEFVRDYSYDPVWEAVVSRDEGGWSAEMRIPFSQLRFHDNQEQEWGLNINRYVPSRNEDMYWVLIPKHETGWASRFGVLTGIRNIKATSRIELFPYLSTDYTHRSGMDAIDLPEDGQLLRFGAGVDMKMGLGPNLTLDATINPDFGQVEADPATVNLSAYEIFYAERRQFFVEGNQLLKGRGPNYFYSRRIGAPPRVLSETNISTPADNTTILGAAKVTGRLESGFSLGALTALTARESVSKRGAVSSAADVLQTSPLSGFAVFRALQETDTDGSSVGFTLTGMKRDLSDEQNAALLTRNAVNGGADWQFRFDQGMFELNGYAGFSHVQGSQQAIALTQLSPTHYFQRPDATHVTFDPERTSLTGYTVALDFSKNSGPHWLWGAGFNAKSPEFEINDTGLLPSADDIQATAHLTYRDIIPGSLFHTWSINLNNIASWNFGGIQRYNTTNLELSAVFKNYWASALLVTYGAPATNDQLTRGGPLMKAGGGVHGYWNIQNNTAEDLRWSGGISGFSDETDSWNYVVDGSIAIRTIGNLEFSFSPSYTRLINTRQYFATFDRHDNRTYGKRYVFSTIDHAILVSHFRMNYAITPDLTIEVYLEPFASSGKYLAFGEMAEGGPKELRVYSTDGTDIALSEDKTMYTVFEGEREVLTFHNPDFNYLSFRSNVVLRWEWRRGSTLFLVWQQNRSGYFPDNQIIGPADLLQSVNRPGDNFIALKISYWLPIS